MLEFSIPLKKGTLIKRYKRFFADVKLEDGQEVVSHCPNTGSMKSCGSPGDTVFLQPSDNPKRKLAYTWEYTQVPGGFIGINTQRPNRIVEAAIREGLIPELRGYESIQREKAYGERSKIDLLLSKKGLPDCYVEIKNVTLREGNQILFPDAVTERGQKHLREMMQLIRSGKRAVMFYLINRPDGELFAPAQHIDPQYAELYCEAKNAGVEMLHYRAKATLDGMTVDTQKKISVSTSMPQTSFH